MPRSLPPLTTLAAQCDRFLGGDGPRSASSLLQQIPPDTALDVYGDGGVVEELEGHVAQLLGKLGVPNRVDLWGKRYDHDWMTWREMLPQYLEQWTRPETQE